MSKVEQGESENIGNNIEITARFLIDQIRREDMDENSQLLLNRNLELLETDPEFNSKVQARKNQIILDFADSRKIPLFTSEDLANAKKHKRKRITPVDSAYQIDLFSSNPIEKVDAGSEVTFDPEKNLNRFHKQMQGRYSWNENKSITREIKEKRNKLRGLIGLPIIRGKSEFAKDKFYIFLVKRVVRFDVFGIFDEYDRVITDIPPELNLKITQVKKLIEELQGGKLNKLEKFRKFDRFEDQFKKLHRDF